MQWQGRWAQEEAARKWILQAQANAARVEARVEEIEAWHRYDQPVSLRASFQGTHRQNSKRRRPEFLAAHPSGSPVPSDIWSQPRPRTEWPTRLPPARSNSDTQTSGGEISPAKSPRPYTATSPADSPSSASTSPAYSPATTPTPNESADADEWSDYQEAEEEGDQTAPTAHIVPETAVNHSDHDGPD